MKLNLLYFLVGLTWSLSSYAYLGTTEQKLSYVKQIIQYLAQDTEYRLVAGTIDISPYKGWEQSILKVDDLLKSGEGDRENVTFILQDGSGKRFSGSVLMFSHTLTEKVLGFRERKVSTIGDFERTLTNPIDQQNYKVALVESFWSGRYNPSESSLAKYLNLELVE